LVERILRFIVVRIVSVKKWRSKKKDKKKKKLDKDAEVIQVALLHWFTVTSCENLVNLSPVVPKITRWQIFTFEMTIEKVLPEYLRICLIFTKFYRWYLVGTFVGMIRRIFV